MQIITVEEAAEGWRSPASIKGRSQSGAGTPECAATIKRAAPGQNIAGALQVQALPSVKPVFGLERSCCLPPVRRDCGARCSRTDPQYRQDQG